MSCAFSGASRTGTLRLPSGTVISYCMQGQQGAGVPLILLPAVGGGARAWGPFGEHLAAQRWLVAFDPPGFGDSSAPGICLSTRRIAGDLLSCIDRLGLERFDVFGISFGSLLACWLAILAGPRARRAVLASCAARGLDFAPRDLRRALRLGADLVAHRHPKQAVAKDLTARPDSKGAGRARANAASDDWSRPRLLHFLAMVLAHAPGAHLRELAAPTLLIHGERDPILSERAQLELLERLPHARLESLAGVGHDLVAEAPAATADLSLAFTRMDQHETG